MIFSRVVNSRSEMGSLRSFAFFTDPGTDLWFPLLDPSSGEATSLVGPVMMRSIDHRTLGQIDRSVAICRSTNSISSFLVFMKAAVAVAKD